MIAVVAGLSGVWVLLILRLQDLLGIKKASTRTTWTLRVRQPRTLSACSAPSDFCPHSGHTARKPGCETCHRLKDEGSVT